MAESLKVDADAFKAAIRALLNSPPEKQADMPGRRVEKIKRKFAAKKKPG